MSANIGFWPAARAGRFPGVGFPGVGFLIIVVVFNVGYFEERYANSSEKHSINSVK